MLQDQWNEDVYLFKNQDETNSQKPNFLSEYWLDIRLQHKIMVFKYWKLLDIFLTHEWDPNRYDHFGTE